MTELDVDALAEWKAVAEKRLRRADIQRRNAPLQEAMQKRMEALVTSVTPNLMADSTADVRKSILAMETSQTDFPNGLAELESKNAENLARVRARTEMLRSWLEALS